MKTNTAERTGPRVRLEAGRNTPSDSGRPHNSAGAA